MPVKTKYNHGYMTVRRDFDTVVQCTKAGDSGESNSRQGWEEVLTVWLTLPTSSKPLHGSLLNWKFQDN